jgi:hypothetical protein
MMDHPGYTLPTLKYVQNTFMYTRNLDMEFSILLMKHETMSRVAVR